MTDNDTGSEPPEVRRRWPGHMITSAIVAVAIVVAVFVVIAVTTNHPLTGLGNTGQPPSSPATTLAAGTFPVETPDGDSLTVSYTGSALAQCTYPGSGTCANAAVDNIVVFQFVIANAGSQVVSDYDPYAVFITLAGPSSTTSDQIDGVGYSTLTVKNLLPSYEATVSTAPVDIPAGETATSVIFVPYQTASQPFPTWSVSIESSHANSWCAQSGDPPGCSGDTNG